MCVVNNIVGIITVRTALLGFNSYSVTLIMVTPFSYIGHHHHFYKSDGLLMTDMVETCCLS
jgi:hypothetical protein